MKINIDYKPKFEEKDKDIDKDFFYAGLTFDYVTMAVNHKYERGIEGQLRRIWGRIQKKFDTLIEEKNYELTLEEAEKDFIKKAFEDAKYPPALSRFINIFEDQFIEKLTDKKPDEK